jgi:tetratricopeptide (TPR) repeat protein
MIRVFISSTSEDLADQRQAAQRVIHELGCHAELMNEYSTADSSPTIAAIRRTLAECQIVVLMVAFRRGGVPTVAQEGDGKNSFTSLEVQFAKKLGIPLLPFFAKPSGWPPELVEPGDDVRDWLLAFRQSINQPATFFSAEPRAPDEQERCPRFAAKLMHALLMELRNRDDWTGPPRAPTRHNLPFPRNPDFVGRQKELKQIHQLLGAHDKEDRAVALTGLGGVGKSQIALEYAHRHLDEFTRVVWIDAATQDLGAQVAAAAAVLALELPEATPVEKQFELLRLAIEECRSILLLLDGCESVDLLRRFVPRSGGCRVLLTTRRRDLAGVSYVFITPPDEKVALRLLCGRKSKSAPEPALTAELCVELGNLPLALKVAGRILGRGFRTVGDLLTDLRTMGPVKFFEETADDDCDGRSGSLGKLFETSIQVLNTDAPVDALARHLFLVAGWFGPAPIPHPLLSSIASRYCGTAGGSQGGHSVARAAERLLDLGLVSSPSQRALSYHALVSAFARHVSGEAGRRESLEALKGYLAAIPEDARGFEALRGLRPHLQHAISALHDLSVSDLLIGLRFVQYLRLIGEYDQAGEIATNALARLQGEDGAELRLLTQYELGQVRIEQGRFDEALTTLRTSLQAVAALCGEDDPNAASVLLAIGQALLRKGLYDEALKAVTRAHEIQQKAGAEDELLGAAIQLALAQILNRREEYAQARQHAEQVMRAYRGRGLESVQAILVAERVLAQALMGESHHDEALEILFPAHARSQGLFGDEDPGTASLQQTIGKTLYRRRAPGDLEKARACQAEALRVFEKAAGPSAPNTALVMADLGKTLDALGDSHAGIERLRRALEIQKATLGPEHPDTLRTARSLNHRTGTPGG